METFSLAVSIFNSYMTYFYILVGSSHQLFCRFFPICYVIYLFYIYIWPHMGHILVAHVGGRVGDV